MSDAFQFFAHLSGLRLVRHPRGHGLQRPHTPSHVTLAASELEAVLHSGVLVVLFPEGTNSGGATVLPFNPPLLQPVAQANHPVTAAQIGYEMTIGDVAEEVCHWRDMPLVPHLINLMSKATARAVLRVQPSKASRGDRKELARQLHAEVTTLGESLAAGQESRSRHEKAQTTPCSPRET